MRVSVRGWKRDHGEIVLAEKDMENTEFSETPISYYEPNQSYLSMDQYGRVRFECRAEMTLNGSYLLSVTLTPQDVARLLAVTLERWTFRAAIRAISRNLPALKKRPHQAAA